MNKRWKNAFLGVIRGWKKEIKAAGPNYERKLPVLCGKVRDVSGPPRGGEDDRSSCLRFRLQRNLQNIKKEKRTNGSSLVFRERKTFVKSCHPLVNLSFSRYPNLAVNPQAPGSLLVGLHVLEITLPGNDCQKLQNWRKS